MILIKVSLEKIPFEYSLILTLGGQGMYYNSLFDEIISKYLFVSILKSPPYFVCSATLPSEFNLIPIWSKLIYVSEMSEGLGWAGLAVWLPATPSDSTDPLTFLICTSK